MEYIIAFKNTNFAIRAEQCLIEEKLHVTVMPLPSQIRAGCGICLRISRDEIKSALDLLISKNIDEISLFSRIAEGNKYLYNEIEDHRALWNKN